jgi:hypothetical protein
MPETACERLARLKARKDEIIEGRAATETQFGEDRVRFGAANLAALDREIQKAQTECDIENGASSPTRRHARGVRFRPH